MKKNSLALIAGVCSAVLSGCANVATFDYSSALETMSKFQEAGTATKTIAVPVSYTHLTLPTTPYV